LHAVKDIDGVWQELEDLVESAAFKTSVVDAINTGSAPFVFNGAQKKLLFAVFILLKAFREGAIR